MSKTWLGRFASRGDDVCPGFWRARFIAECPHQCRFCYLPGTYRYGFPDPLGADDVKPFLEAMRRWMQSTSCEYCRGTGTVTETGTEQDHRGELVPIPVPARCPVCRGTGGALFTNGELSDSFAPWRCFDISMRLIEVFREQTAPPFQTLLLVTKGTGRPGEVLPEELLEIEPHDNVVLSASLAQYTLLHDPIEWHIAPSWGTPDQFAALRQRGWRIRLRVDPIIQRQWLGEHSDEFVDLVQAARPERMTLGTLRFTESSYRRMAAGEPVMAALAACVEREDPEAGGHPWRVPFAEREAIYRAILAVVKSDRAGRPWDPPMEAGLCKETAAMWGKLLGGVPAVPACNCTL